MIKKYKCQSEISFNINIDDKRKRISFDPFSRGGSEYITSNTKIQQEIEKQSFFGTLVVLVESKKETKKEEESNLNKENTNTNTTLTPVEGITNCADAKLYLFEKGVTATLRSKEQIHAIATELGIEFVDLK